MKYFVIGFILLLTACSDDDSSSTKSKVEPLDSSNIKGAWKSDCYLDDHGDYIIDELIITEDYFSVNEENYHDDSDCTGDSDAHELLFSYALEGPLTSADGVEAYQLTLTHEASDIITEVPLLVHRAGYTLYFGDGDMINFDRVYRWVDYEYYCDPCMSNRQ